MQGNCHCFAKSAIPTPAMEFFLLRASHLLGKGISVGAKLPTEMKLQAPAIDRIRLL